jgi:exosortase
MERGIAATAPIGSSAAVWGFLLDLRAPTAVERSRVVDWARQPATALNLALVATLFGLWVTAFFPTLTALVDRWSSDENYSHGFLTPIVSLYLAIQNFKARPIEGRPRGGLVLGGLVILLGMSAGCVTVLFPSLLAECVAMLSVLAGGILLLGGREWWSRLQTPTLFLLFAVPWPSALYSRIAFPLQQMVCQAAAVVIELFGVPVLREGNVIHLPKQSMHVAQACSGMRQLTAFLAISTCAALLMNRPKWYRAILFFSAIPIAVAINIIRVSATGLVMTHGDPAWTQGTMHTVEGLVMVALGMGVLWCEIRVLDWMLEPSNPAPTVNALPAPAGQAV